MGAEAGDARPAVAVIGMACRFPGARDPDELWRNLRDGAGSLLRLSESDLDEAGVPLALRRDPRFVPVGTLVDGFDRFDAAFFGFSPGEAAAIDPQHRVFLECAWQALEAAGCDPGRRAETTAVFASAAANGYWRRARGATPPDRRWRGEPGDLAGFVSACLGLHGPSLNVQSACSSSLVAVHLACESLLGGRCDLALAGGVSIRLPQKSGYLHEEGGITSPDGRCRAFDARGEGTVFGSGAGVVVLKRLADALADRDRVAAIILGSAVNNDGAGKPGFTAPSVAGQAEVISLAQAVAGVSPEEISCIEGHGTGTLLGDALELEALTHAFGARAGGRWCALGSVKANLGHLETASGVAGLIKTVLALEHRLLPPSPGFERPHPELETPGSPFFVNARPAPWETAALPRRAGVSSFGIGGTNAHLVLEEAAPAPPAERSRPGQLLVLSAATGPALAARAAGLADHLGRRPDLDLADVAWTLQTGRRPLPWRQAVACADLPRAMAARPVMGRAGSVPPEVVFLFPGQGTQRVGMAGELYRSEPAFRRRLDHCAEALKTALGCDFRDCLFPAGAAAAAARRLADTALAQPILFAVEHCLASLWRDWGVRPAAMLGDSLGEYVAACLAGVFALEEGLELTAARGRLLAGLPEGRMLAVALPAREAEERLADGLALAAVHGPRRCVVAGPRGAVEELERRLAQDGIACRRVPATRAFHSPMMSAAAEPLLAVVSRLDLRVPRIPYLSNVTGTWITAEEATDPRYWVRHLLSPVRLERGIAELSRGPERLLLEVGPGRTLAAAVGGGRVVGSLAGPEGSDRLAMLAALGRLWVRGVEVDWPALHAGERRSRVRLPTYPFESRRCWLSPAGGDLPEAVEATAPPAPAPAPPADARESLLREIWQEVLGITEVGVDDHFLELGGDSILAALIAGRARAAGLPVAPEHLFLHPTVAQLAAATAAGSAGGEAGDAAPAFALDPAGVERLLAKRSAGR